MLGLAGGMARTLDALHILSTYILQHTVFEKCLSATTFLKCWGSSARLQSVDQAPRLREMWPVHAATGAKPLVLHSLCLQCMVAGIAELCVGLQGRKGRLGTMSY